ncbi:kinase-like domain-containing protein [Mycena vulgaris]|nr:kinase-like domain-containing protein [Mycena vulgaris]
METRRSTADFMTNLQSEDITQDEEREFLKTREEAIRRGNEYHDSIASYKSASWLNPIIKLRKKNEVRKRKRLTRQSNYSLRSLNESMYSGSDTFSTCASSGSPPGSNLAADDIEDWANEIQEVPASPDAGGEEDGQGEEDREDYGPDGDRVLKIGEAFSDNRYVVVRNLDLEDSESTLWLAWDSQVKHHVMLKVFKSLGMKQKVFQRLDMHRTSDHPGQYQLVDLFRIGPRGTHDCMVFEVLHESLLYIINRYQDTGVPIPLVKRIAKQMLLGLDYMHRFCNVVHTTINPEAVLMQLDDGDEDGIGTTVKIADLENATVVGSDFLHNNQTPYRSPEVIVGSKLGTSADIWSVACVIFGLVTGGENLFDLAEGDNNTDDDHLAQIIELTRECPRSISQDGIYSSQFFDQGKLRRRPNLMFCPLDVVLHEKTCLPKAAADALASFLRPMLRMDPEERAEAHELLSHRWLNGVVIQGEVDVMIYQAR